jgi:hypothetical protein
MELLVAFESGDSWISKLIIKMTKKRSHCLVIYRLADYMPYKTFEATFPKCVHMDLRDRGLTKNHSIYRIPIQHTTNIAEFYEMIMKYHGKPYGVWQLIGDAIPALLRKIGINARNPIKHDVVCSEICWIFIMEYIQETKTMVNLADFDQNTVTPDDVECALDPSECKQVTLKELLNA